MGDPLSMAHKQIHSAIRWGKPDYKGMIGGDLAKAEIVDDRNGNTCIHLAAQNGHLDIVKDLLSMKVDPNKKNNGGQTAMHMAKAYDYNEVYDALIAAGGDPNITNGAGHPACKGIDGDK